MDNKKIITAISIVVTIAIIFIASILIINKINLNKKTTVAGNNISKTDELPTNEPSNKPSINTSEELLVPSSLPSPTATPKLTTAVRKYYIEVNNQVNTVTIYVKDANGSYTIPVKVMVCSTGQASPKNTKYSLKEKWNGGPLFGGVYGQYISQINGNILFHSVPYLRRYDYNSLEYWEYDKLGTTCSAGCIRLTVADAKWIYDNCPPGTTVEFYSSSISGPLGKPSAMKISSYTEYRGWDPTDPNSNNPWRNAVLEVSSPSPSEEPTVEPSMEPTVMPTIEPSIEPTVIPSIEPTLKYTPIVEESNITSSSNGVDILE